MSIDNGNRFQIDYGNTLLNNNYVNFGGPLKTDVCLNVKVDRSKKKKK